jgi:hypothetical protein
MNTFNGNTWDSTSDIHQLGLMAATSPDFAETMIRILLQADAAAGEPAAMPQPATPAAAQPATQAATQAAA